MDNTLTLVGAIEPTLIDAIELTFIGAILLSQVGAIELSFVGAIGLTVASAIRLRSVSATGWTDHRISYPFATYQELSSLSIPCDAWTFSEVDVRLPCVMLRGAQDVSK